MDELTGTKERIFDAFIEMTSSMGYENVTVREIAKKIGINAASIYYHYESKEQVLAHVYEYYSEYYFENRKPVEAMKEMIETADAEEFIFAMARNFVSDDQKKTYRMVLITKIIYMRLFQDAMANRMFNENNQNEIRYITDIVQHGIQVGRIQSDFEVEIFASVLLNSMIAMGLVAFADPNYTAGLLDHEARVRSMLARLFTSALA